LKTSNMGKEWKAGQTVPFTGGLTLTERSTDEVNSPGQMSQSIQANSSTTT